MTRGNQRDLAREKNMKKQKGAAGSSKDHEGNQGLSLEARKARDAEVMRLKQEAALAKKAEGGGAGSSASK